MSVCSLILCAPLLTQAADRFPRPSINESTITQHRSTVVWEPQEHVAYYRIRLLDGTCSTLLRVKDVSAEKTKKRLKKLTSNTQYCVRMRAVYTDGTKSGLSKRRRFTTATEASSTVARQDRFGLNFIRYYSTDSDAMASVTDPSVVDADFSALGIDTFRQITSADLIWDTIEKKDNTFTFDAADGVLMHTAHSPIVDLFSYQLASSRTPEEILRGNTTPEKSLTAEAEAYVIAVVDRYKEYVRYWEIGNEMAHWELEQPNAFPVAEQALWLKAVAEVIRAHDDDAVIVLPGLISITEDNVDDWLPGVIESAGTEWFDVVNYHYYGRWQAFTRAHDALYSLSQELGIADKPFWQTETGTSSDPTNTDRTDYPNSPEQQAADIFRRSLLAYSVGDELIMWHTYIGNDDDGEPFRYFGIVREDLTKELAYYSTQLLTSEITQFTSVERIDTGHAEEYVFAITRTDGSMAYVAWTDEQATPSYSNTFEVPEHMSTTTSVVPNSTGAFKWSDTTPGENIVLTDIPVLVR